MGINGISDFQAPELRVNKVRFLPLQSEIETAYRRWIPRGASLPLNFPGLTRFLGDLPEIAKPLLIQHFNKIMTRPWLDSCCYLTGEEINDIIALNSKKGVGIDLPAEFIFTWNNFISTFIYLKSRFSRLTRKTIPPQGGN